MVLERIITLISEQLLMEEESIGEDATFEDLGAEEDDIAELAHAIESEFEIVIHEDELIRISKVSDMVGIVETAITLAEI